MIQSRSFQPPHRFETTLIGLGDSPPQAVSRRELMIMATPTAVESGPSWVTPPRVPWETSSPEAVTRWTQAALLGQAHDAAARARGLLWALMLTAAVLVAGAAITMLAMRTWMPRGEHDVATSTP